VAAVVLALAVLATAVILWNNRAQPESASPRVGTQDPLGQRRTAPPVTAISEPTGDIPPEPSFAPASDADTTDGTEAAAALERFQSAISENPSDAAALAGAGRALLALRRNQEALPPLKQAMDLQPDNASYAFSYGYAAAVAGELTEASSGFRHARRLMPRDATTSYDLALALQKLRDDAGAVQEYTSAIDLGSQGFAARLGRAIALDRLGQTRDAAAAYGDALNVMPPGPDADRVRARLARLEK
jgi:Flp pilus assembly protein TadD